MERYNFDKKAKLYKVCNLNDDFRPTLGNVFFDNGKAVASNGHTMIVAPINQISNLNDDMIDKLNGKLLNGRSYKKLLEYDFISDIDDEGITCTKRFQTVKFLFDKLCGKYPDYNSVFPTKMGSVPYIGLRGKCLYELCESVGQKYAKIEFSDTTGAAKVSFRDSDIKGIIMPALVDDYQLNEL